MKLLILFALVTLSFAQPPPPPPPPRVKLDIFYEALCPDTFQFISVELLPLYADFRQNLDILFIPFGKGNSSRSTPEAEPTFWCQRGNPECLGNRIQTCVLSRLPAQDDQVEYVGCQMSFGSDPSHQPCVESSGLLWSEISECANSTFAVNLQLSYEQITIPVMNQFNFVPTVAYNGKIFEFSHTARAPALRLVLCDLLNNATAACA